MDAIRLVGGVPLRGTVAIRGAKNAALPLLAASLLTDQPLILENLPHLADVTLMGNLLAQLGVDLALDGLAGKGGERGRVLRLQARDLTSTTAPYDLVRRMRASVLVLGPLLARAGAARVSLPGGCAIGTRPIDLHLLGLRALGAQIDLEDGYVRATAPLGLTGATIDLPFASVGATENILMAAVLARGQTVLRNPAREPEIVDLADCLVAMGGRITGAGTPQIVIDGVDRLHGATHPIIPDRIEAGTFAIAAVMTGGDLLLTQMRPGHLAALWPILAAGGARLSLGDSQVQVTATGRLHAAALTTEPYPGFPTDLQAQVMAALCLADGQSRITETIFENRFMHVPELLRMGAEIRIHQAVAEITGVPRLLGAPVMATDLRASVSLVLAGLAATDETVVRRIYHLDRGYERIEERLAACGARIERIKGTA